MKPRAREARRGSPRQRGYSAQWDAISVAHRTANPFCAMCEQEGRTQLGDDVDHIVPIDDGGDMLAADNRWTLCRRHHNGLKRRLQEFAKTTDRMDELREWCLHPETRPIS